MMNAAATQIVPPGTAGRTAQYGHHLDEPCARTPPHCHSRPNAASDGTAPPRRALLPQSYDYESSDYSFNDDAPTYMHLYRTTQGKWGTQCPTCEAEGVCHLELTPRGPPPPQHPPMLPPSTPALPPTPLTPMSLLNFESSADMRSPMQAGFAAAADECMLDQIDTWGDSIMQVRVARGSQIHPMLLAAHFLDPHRTDGRACAHPPYCSVI
jgi:hypothetical protein